MTDFHSSAYQLARLLLASLVEIHRSEGINSHSAGDLRRAEELDKSGEIYEKRPGQCDDSIDR